MKAVSVIATLVLIGLIVTILRSSPDEPAVSTAVVTEVTTPERVTDGSTATTIAPTPTAPPVTDDTGAPITTEPADGLSARFVITEVSFGDNGYVAITNVGGATGSLEGYALCQRPSYLVFPDIELNPFSVLWVALGDGGGITNPSITEIIPANGQLGSTSPADGEMALYRAAIFDDPGQMVSYVEWGTSGHGRSALAVEAGLWTEGAFIELPPDTFGVSALVTVPSGPDDWTAQIGG